MAASEQNRPVSFSPDHPLRQRLLVLVTDDHEDTRLLFRTILGLDSRLSHLDGLRATRRIRGLSNGRHTPIVFICGRAEPNFCDVAFDAGCDEFLVKPLNFELLAGVLEKASRRVNRNSAV
jgi:PleD family two-component response regulator